MSERTHFRCRAYGMLSVTLCQVNRDKAERLACQGCDQMTGVDAGTEPSLTTLEALAGAVRPARSPAAHALPPDSPMASVGRGVTVVPRKPSPAELPVPTVHEYFEARRPAKPPPVPDGEVGVQGKPAPVARGSTRAIPPVPAPPVLATPARVLRLLRDLAARRIGMPEARRRANRALKALGRKAPRDTWETL